MFKTILYSINFHIFLFAISFFGIIYFLLWQNAFALAGIFICCALTFAMGIFLVLRYKGKLKTKAYLFFQSLLLLAPCFGFVIHNSYILVGICLVLLLNVFLIHLIRRKKGKEVSRNFALWLCSFAYLGFIPMHNNRNDNWFWIGLLILMFIDAVSKALNAPED